ncbi:MAG: aspartate-semialdehyde dehydrogenase [Candidatus Caldatribacteriota bacterium]
MKKVGLIGWRGMVGSVLLDRMIKENDFKDFESYFFTTSQQGQKAPVFENANDTLLDAFDINELQKMDILLSCQGGEYTKEVYGKLRESGWKGYWIDAASALRMNKESLIVLDPVNRGLIEEYIAKGGKELIGGNCTVSLLLIALDGLFKEGLIDWISSMTYQAASGAGAKNMIELLSQMQKVGHKLASHPSADALFLEKEMTQLMNSNDFPTQNFGHPLALNVLPWIDVEMPSGQSKEEWKAQVEANKILGNHNEEVKIDGSCVRVGALRSHSQGLTIKLKKSTDIKTVEDLLKNANPWVNFVENNKADSLKNLTPAAVSGTMNVAIGRVRKMTLGDEYINAFTVGDQLLWGAAEPLRCVLKMLVN